MHIDSLRFFYNVALSKSISTVAKQSHISQSALSQQLVKLENKLDVKLLNRSNKGVTLTPEGEILFKHCETILNTYQKLEDEIFSSTLEQNYISIEAIESLASTMIPPAILKLKNSFTDYNINLNSVHDCTTSNLLNNICDISLCYKKPDDNEGIVVNHIGNDDIVLVADASFGKNSLTLDELFSTAFIEYSVQNTLNLIINEKLTDIFPSFDGFNVLYTTNSCFSGLRGLKSSRAVTFIPKSIYNSYYLTSSIKLIHVENFKLDLPIYICYYDSFYKQNSAFIKSFKNIIKGFL